MPEIVAPVMVGLDTQTAVAAAQTVFDDARIDWVVVNYNAGNGRMDLMGSAPGSENKVVVSVNPRAAVAVYKDRVGAVLLESRSLGSVGEACSDLKTRISSDHRLFAN